MDNISPQNSKFQFPPETKLSPSTPARTLKLVVLGLLILLPVVGVGAFYLGQQKNALNSSQVCQYAPRSCTQEAKLCPDGTAVGRSGPNCEFSPCSTEANAKLNLKEGWKLYSDEKLGFSLASPYEPAKVFVPVQGGEGVLIISGQFNFRTNDLPDCSEGETADICILPGEGWGQAKNVQEVMIDGKKAESFFVKANNIDNKGSTVIHVVHMLKTPTFEIAMAVDGVGLEEQFQEILKTVELLR